MDDWMTAEQAANALGVTRSTLYAYVSRGLLRSAPTSGTQQSRYRRREIERLAIERERARKPAMVARASLDWGRPVLDSALTLIEGGRLYYRGRDAIELARHATLEDVAALLLECDPRELVSGAPPRIDRSVLRMLERLDPVQGCTAGFAWLHGLDDGGTAQDATAPPAVLCTRLLRLMTAVVTRRVPARTPVHCQLARAWQLDERGTDLVRQSLVLCADHELNASSFAARCVASTGADLGACVTAGLAALSGSRHCGVTAAIESLWERSLRAGRNATEFNQLLDERNGVGASEGAGVPGQATPGFGHPLYPDGDPRAQALLAAIPRRDRNERLMAAVLERSGMHPSIDYALVAMRRSLGLEDGHAYLVFALGRTVGWLAHAVEQRRADVLIRPRAAYTGQRPAEGAAGAAPATAPSLIIRRR
jgi:citrate synthase